MKKQTSEILGVMYGIHAERFRLRKTFEQLPLDVQKKHKSTLQDVEETIHQCGHTIAEIVLDTM